MPSPSLCRGNVTEPENVNWQAQLRGTLRVEDDLS